MDGREGVIHRQVGRFGMLALVLSVPALGLLAFLVFSFFKQPRAAPAVPAAKKQVVASSPKKQIVLIVDDIGYDASVLGQLTSLAVPLTFAVIPGTPEAGPTAQRLVQDGFEVLCHIPMEPLGSWPAGSEVIGISMTDDQIRVQTRRLLRSVPQARGVNNHMGSRATRDPRVMTQIMRVLKEEGLYFVDSVTTAETVGLQVARKVGVRAAARHIFLDHDLDDGSIRRQVAALAALSEKQGLAIGIAHPHAATVRVLRDELPRLQARGFHFIPAALAVN